MPDKCRHFDKYKHNKEFLDKCILDKVEYADWAITTTFYCAVHLIEMKFATLGCHNTSHLIRNKEIKKKPEFQECRTHYRNLYQNSQKARYDCICLSNNDYLAAEKNLLHIENCLLK